jgi:Tol biopolymer transport system component
VRTLSLGLGLSLVFAAAAAGATSTSQSKVRNGPLTVFPGDVSHQVNSGPVATIVTVGGGKPKAIWHCPHHVGCGQPVSFAWGPNGRRVAFTLDEIDGTSPYVGFHVVNAVSGQDTRVPGGAPQTASTSDDPAAWSAYFKKMNDRVGCWPAANLAWSADGSSIAYNCGPHINVLKLRGSGHVTVPTGSAAFWPSWSPNGTRIAYSTHLRPTGTSEIYTVGLDGSHRRLVASAGAAPAWSPDGRTIAYQTKCGGIRLVTPSGRNVIPRWRTNVCGAIGRHSGPPVWSPDGRKLAFETGELDANAGIYVMDKRGIGLHLVSHQATTTWYGALPGRPSWQPTH